MQIVQFFAASGECGGSSTILDTSCLSHAQAGSGALSTALNIVFGITASIAVLMIVIGGLRYVLAHGDPNGTAQARNTMIYAVVGLLVTMAAFAIVTFVVGWVGK
jgi:hypothetical protein